jgi:hypothetical protein
MIYTIFNKKKNITKFGLFLSIIFIFISIFILYYLYFKLNNFVQTEYFSDKLPHPNKLSSQIPDGEDYLYPVHSLDSFCRSKNLLPSHVNRLCLMKDNTYKPLSNCKCEDQNGYCAICYPENKIDNSGRSIIYDANNIS